MKAHLELALVNVANPRVVQVVLFALALALMVLSNTELVYASPVSGGGGCSGG